MYDRRDFIKYTGLAAAGGLILASGTNLFSQNRRAFAVPVQAYSEPPGLFVRQAFEPLIGTDFRVLRDGLAPVSMQLVEVVANPLRAGTTPVDGFLLIFETTGRERLLDNIYSISHPDLGTFSIFISTVGRSGRRYQAAFARVYS